MYIHTIYTNENLCLQSQNKDKWHVNYKVVEQQIAVICIYDMSHLKMSFPKAGYKNVISSSQKIV